MPDINPMDSYARRLSGESDKAARDREAAEKAAEQAAGGPFDSYAGRLDEAMKGTKDEAAPADPAASPPPPPQVAPAPIEDVPAGPVGQGDYVVKSGDCIENIASDHGLLFETVWDDPANSELRETRKNPNVLMLGDRVSVRDKRRKDEPGETEQVHRFRRKGIPSRLRLRYFIRGEPRASERYVITVDGKRHTGELDADGMLEVPIAPDARRATVRIGDDSRVQRLILGSTEPVSEISGVQCRLNNLGFRAGPNDNILGPKTEAALREFQELYELDVTGRPDPPTRQKLVELNGS